MLIASDYVPYREGVYRAGDEALSHTPYALAGMFRGRGHTGIHSRLRE